MISRRRFLVGSAAVVATVAVGPALAGEHTLWLDGVHDDAQAINALFRGEAVRLADGTRIREPHIDGATIHIESPIIMNDQFCRITNTTILPSPRNGGVFLNVGEGAEGCHLENITIINQPRFSLKDAARDAQEWESQCVISGVRA